MSNIAIIKKPNPMIQFLLEFFLYVFHVTTKVEKPMSIQRSSSAECTRNRYFSQRGSINNVMIQPIINANKKLKSRLYLLLLLKKCLISVFNNIPSFIKKIN